MESDDTSNEAPKIYNLSDLLDRSDNILLLGDRQTGKTSLAYYIAYQFACVSWSNTAIPVVIDLRGFKHNQYSLKRAVNNFYDNVPTGFDIDDAIRDGLFVFIADNLSVNAAEIEKFAKHVETFSKCRWIAFGTPNSDGVSPERAFKENLPDFERFHLRELSRSGIRTLARNWAGGCEDRATNIFNTVMNQLIRDGLPRTPYMVSLLVWALQQKSDLQRLNEATLLANIIDHLLGKADFTLSLRGTLNPLAKEITLQHLAKYFHEREGVASENEVLSLFVTFFAAKKLPYIASDVLNKLVSCGILKRESDTIAFKYPCFQEYFFASLMKNDRTLLDFFLEDLNFLKVRRELELLAGLRQQNDDIINAIVELLNRREPERFKNRASKDFEKIAPVSLKIGVTRAELGKIRRTRLTHEQIDEIMDETDRRALSRGERPVSESLDRAEGNVAVAAKEREAEAIAFDHQSPSAPIRPNTHMAAIDTLARVIRNSDFTDYDVKGPATKKVLESWVKIFLLILEELREVISAVGEKTGDPVSQDEMSSINYLMSKFMFGVVGSSVVSHLSAPSISQTLHAIIDEGGLSTGEKLLALFLLEDVNDAEWKQGWSSVISDKKHTGFVIDCLITRLMSIAHSKALDDNQAERVKDLVSEIEKKLGWTNEQKSSVIQNLQGAANLAAVFDT